MLPGIDWEISLTRFARLDEEKNRDKMNATERT